MRIRIISIVLVLTALCGVMGTFGLVAAPPADAAQAADTDVPPGNPVVGSDLPGDREPDGETNYLLWSLVAVCLIGAGVLLVNIERWEARRIEQAERTPTI